ncbi:MAG: serine/threonine-protein phosphatase [Gammaproteobacteria bacterium]|nr:serine/threonine-protein phosphatase [Gammaproteobacteria bacterium]
MGEQTFHWTSTSRTHVGRVRELNEDACLEMSDRGLWAVADGMGGHAAGDVASRMVIDALRKARHPDSLSDLLNDVRHSLQKVNHQLTEEANRRRQQIVGSTVAVLLVFDQHCVSLWAGDSRIYRIRDGQLQQLTRDHSQIEELVARGVVSREEARKLPGSNAITRAIGVMDRVELDSEIHSIQEGDRFLLCSDGLYNEVSTEDIKRILALENCQESADRLLQSALEHGARDNVTLVVVRADDSQITKTVFNPSASRLNHSDKDDDEKTKINR